MTREEFEFVLFIFALLGTLFILYLFWKCDDDPYL